MRSDPQVPILNPVLTYVDCFVSFQEATRRVETLVTVIQQVSTRIRDWRTVKLPGSPPTPAPANPQEKPIILSGWPTADELVEALTEWHRTRASLQKAWSWVPEDRRSALAPPP